jgi:hypothetical protein
VNQPQKKNSPLGKSKNKPIFVPFVFFVVQNPYLPPASPCRTRAGPGEFKAAPLKVPAYLKPF